MRKKYIILTNETFKYKLFIKSLLFSLLGVMILLSSCNDEVDDKYVTTFTEEMMGEYFINRPQEYSEFIKLLDTTDVMGLLNTYGEYTCFAPDNNAMLSFYKKLGKESLQDFPFDTLTKIAYDHLIRDAEILSEDFYQGRITKLTMSQRYISIGFKSYPILTVNETSQIVKVDEEVHNGVIHCIDEVLKPTDLTIVGAVEEDSIFTLFYEALQYTGLEDQLRLIEDKSYDPKVYDYIVLETINGNKEELPEFRKYGYTLLMESDSTFKAAGIENIEDMKAYAAEVYDAVYPEDAHIEDLTDPKNSLNRFIAYHLFNKQLGYRKFIIDYDETGHSIKTYDMFEYIETMCPNTLIEVRTDRATSRTNLFNMNSETGEAIQIVSTNYDNDAINGVYHEIDGILKFDRAFVSEISGKRLRMDGASFFPEIANNNMRANGEVHRYVIPKGYFERLKVSETTKFTYLNADHRYEDYQGDELWLKGLYEFEVITPPVPAGTYEVRIGYQPTPWRGVAQLYWDGKPCGIPLDLVPPADDPSIGYKTPGEDPADINGFENDKMMRNRGYMKGPASYRAVVTDYYSTQPARMSVRSLRRILGIYTFDNMEKHTYKVKGYKNGEFMIDYIEFVPLEVLEYEGID